MTSQVSYYVILVTGVMGFDTSVFLCFFYVFFSLGEEGPAFLLFVDLFSQPHPLQATDKV